MPTLSERLRDFADRYDGYAPSCIEEAADELDRLAALAVPPVPTAGWQPIATAPKDGTEILLHQRRTMGGGTIVNGSWNSGGAMHMPHWMSALGGAFQPTHWQPLPPALPSPPQEPHP